MTISEILEANRTKTGRVPSLKEISSLLTKKQVKTLSKLTETYPLKAAAFVFDYGYPKCEVCGKKVTTLSTNAKYGSVFNKTCSAKCAGQYRISKSAYWILQKETNFRQVVKALSKNQNFKLASKKEDTRFRVTCTRCTKTKNASPKSIISGRLSCSCVRADRISKARLISSEVFEKRARLKARKIKLLAGYAGMNKKTKAKCLVCSTIWEVCPGNLLHSGCPKCAPAKMRRRSLSKYGVEYPNQLPEVKAKICATMRKRYGVDYATQNKEILEKNLKSAYALKDYKLGNRVVKVQGYEPQALSYLVKERKVRPQEIVCGFDSDMPSIRYFIKGKEHIYHPDIFIPKQNRIVEVKSEYTARLAKNLKAKRKACESQGYKFTLLIMSPKGVRLNEPRD